MKAIGILWNSMDEYATEAINDIKNYATISDVISINFNDEFPDFISIIYPYTGTQVWKLEYKIGHMYNNYHTNKIKILFLEFESGNKVYIERKGIYLYENVEKIKNIVRGKYKNMVHNYAFDNVYHMTDNEEEYRKTSNTIINYMLSYFERKRKIIHLDNLLLFEKKFMEQSLQYGKRNKFLICDDQLLYKEQKNDSYESYAEVFCSKLFKILGIPVADYYLANYNGKTGVLTRNFIGPDEIFIDGTHIIDTYLNYMETGQCSFSEQVYHDMELIVKYNNFDDLPSIIDVIVKNLNLNLSNILEGLRKMYAIDIILLQSDRNPNNWGILYNIKTQEVKFAPLYDNSNILGFHKPDTLKQMREYISSDSIFRDLLYQNSVTLLQLHRDTNFFTPKDQLIDGIDDHDILQYMKNFIDCLETIDIVDLLNQVINTMPYEMPVDFKNIVAKALSNNVQYIKSSFENKKAIKKLS